MCIDTQYFKTTVMKHFKSKLWKRVWFRVERSCKCTIRWSEFRKILSSGNRQWRWIHPSETHISELWYVLLPNTLRIDIIRLIEDLSANIIHHDMKHYIGKIPTADEWRQCGRCNDVFTVLTKFYFYIYRWRIRWLRMTMTMYGWQSKFDCHKNYGNKS